MRSRLARLGLVALLALPFAFASNAHAVPGPNLVRNAGFENSPTDPSGDVTHQPLLPTDWAVEGSAGLFDHSENGHHGGRRMAAISIPASTPRVLCQQGTCVESPLNIVKDETTKYASITPFWRTLNPVPVVAGRSYTFSYWTAMDLATTNVGGAISRVRWVGANGVVISMSNGPSNIQKSTDPPQTVWEEVTRTGLTAPSGATGAIIMVGAADDLFITQVKFDDVKFFQTTV